MERKHTFVARATDAIVAAAARGSILPGDRIVEADIAQRLGMSRVPVREALRLLESQGVVTSTPFCGIRLMAVSRKRIAEVVEVRLALEPRAALDAIAAGRHQGTRPSPLEHVLEDLSRAAERRDAYRLAVADTAFHRALCALGGNDVLCLLWESLARQLTVIVGLSTLGKSMPEIVAEHRVLLDAFRRGDATELTRVLEEHIDWQNRAVDYGRIVAERRHAPRPRAAA